MVIGSDLLKLKLYENYMFSLPFNTTLIALCRFVAMLLKIHEIFNLKTCPNLKAFLDVLTFLTVNI